MGTEKSNTHLLIVDWLSSELHCNEGVCNRATFILRDIIQHAVMD